MPRFAPSHNNSKWGLVMLAKRDRELARKIEAAFAAVEYPGDDNLVNIPIHWSCEDIPEEFRGKHWKNISARLAYWYRTELPCFTPSALHFYFPAFLIASLSRSKFSGDIEDF